MKKIPSWLAVLTISAGLTACAGGDRKDPASEPPPDAAAEGGAVPELLSPVEVELTEELRAAAPGSAFRAATVDFDGDGKNDYLVQSRSTRGRGGIREHWITSELKVAKSGRKPEVENDRMWFANLDEDPEMEILHAYGPSDKLDFSIYDQKPGSKYNTLLFRFHPVLVDAGRGGGRFWGFIEDISGIRAVTQGGAVKLQVAFDHQLTRSGAAKVPKWQKNVPVVFFTGSSTHRAIEWGEVSNTEWLSLREIAARVR